MKRLAAFFLLLCLPVSVALAGQESWILGQTLKTMQFVDQHGHKQVIDETTRLLLFAPDRAAARLVHAAVEKQAADYLSSRKVVYVADISRMPGLIARIFAIPRMKDYLYPIALGRKTGDSAAFPRQKGNVSLILLDRLQLKGISFGASADEIFSHIEGEKR